MMMPFPGVGLPPSVARESSRCRMTAPSPVVELRTRVQTLQLSTQATCDAAFPVETADNPVATEECLQALLALLQAVVTKAIRQGAATMLAAAQL